MSSRILFSASLILFPFIVYTQTMDSLQIAIREQIAYQQIFSAWQGVPTEHFDNMEVFGYSTLDRDIYFTDSLFEEFVLVDEWEELIIDLPYGLTDTCSFVESNEIIVYSGTWRLNADTVVLEIANKTIYNETTDFFNSFYEYHCSYPRVTFNCSSALRHRCDRAEEKKLLFVNDQIKEIGGREICYK